MTRRSIHQFTFNCIRPQTVFNDQLNNSNNPHQCHEAHFQVDTLESTVHICNAMFIFSRTDSESVVKPRVSKFVTALQQQKLKSGTRQLKSHELAYFGIGSNRPRFDSSSSFRNGYSSAQKYESSGDEVETRSSLKRLMGNRQVENENELRHTFEEKEIDRAAARLYDRKMDRKRDEDILDELTKASEDIMNVSVFLCRICLLRKGIFYRQ